VPVVFKALLGRTRDCADIEAVADAGATDLAEANAWVRRVLGDDGPIAKRRAALES
jgi:hypothetical protein